MKEEDIALAGFNFTVCEDQAICDHDFGEPVGKISCEAVRASPEPTFEWTLGEQKNYTQYNLYETAAF